MTKFLYAGRLFAAAILFLCLAVTEADAQQKFSVTGTVVDTTATPLQGATVVALQKPDSVMAAFSVTRKDGSFDLKRLEAGEYIIQVTFVGFGTKYASVTLDDKDVNIGRVELVESTTELDELTVSAEHVPMLIKNDTLDYNAQAFKTRPNANVEELLRKLPGIEVEGDGSIKAQGEDVEKVLVDGKEFFGDDPRIATQNLPADAVDRVQVYDKQSDLAEFTGVDDGEEQRTINLALKEDSRQGYFGNVSGGVGPDNRYDGKASINRFSPTTQMSVLANVNNVNRQSFSFSEYVGFMGGMQTLMSGGGGFEMIGGSFGGQPSDGISRTTSGGINFNYDFSSKTKLRSSYFANHIDNDQTRDLLQQQLLGSNVSSIVNQASDRNSKTLAHRLNLNLEHKTGKGRDARLRSNLRYSTSDLVSESFRETSDDTGELENDSRTDYLSEGQSLSGDTRLTLRQRLGESGRSIVSESSASFRDNDTEGDLTSLNNFYDAGDILTAEEVSQLQDQLSFSNTLRQRLTYIEPFSGRTFLKVTSELRRVSENENKSIYDRVDDLLVIDTDLSREFDRVYRYAKGGATFNSRRGGLRYSFGAEVQASELRGDLVDTGDLIERSFVNVLPQATASYEFAQARSLDLRYSTSTREPSVRDLQPFVDNTDPLNIYVGNPDLKPELSHNLHLQYMLFDQFSFTNLFVFVRGTYTDNKIISSRTIDDLFRQTQSRVNRDGVWSISGNISFGTPIRALGAKVRLRSTTTTGRNYEIINGAENASDLIRQSVDLRLENRSKDIVDFSVGSRYTFNINRYELNEDLNQNYINKTFYSNLTLDLPSNWVVTSSIDYKIYSPDVFGSGQNIPLWEAGLSKTLLGERAELKFTALDLLNRDVGFAYSSSGSFLSEERVNSLGRYFLLKFVYNLGRKSSNSRAGNVEIIG